TSSRGVRPLPKRERHDHPLRPQRREAEEEAAPRRRPPEAHAQPGQHARRAPPPEEARRQGPRGQDQGLSCTPAAGGLRSRLPRRRPAGAGGLLLVPAQSSNSATTPAWSEAALLQCVTLSKGRMAPDVNLSTSAIPRRSTSMCCSFDVTASERSR